MKKNSYIIEKRIALFSIYLMLSLTIVSAGGAAAPLEEGEKGIVSSLANTALDVLDFLLPSVSAQDTCCIRTTTNSYCVEDIDVSECDVPLEPGECFNVQECHVGTCVQTNGDCDASMPKQKCDDNFGQWIDRPLLEISACTPTCCIYTDEGKIVDTEHVFFRNKCERLPQFEEEELNLETRDINFASCEVLVDPETKGYCTIEDKAICEYLSKESCDSAGGDFSSQRCNSCEPNFETQCFNGEQGYGVYNFDSCDGPGDIAQTCSLNEICEEDEDTEIPGCVEKTCELDIKFTNLGYDTEYFKAGEVEIDGIIGGSRVSTKISAGSDQAVSGYALGQGEQACVKFQGPGEQHYAVSCVFGEMQVFGVGDTREKVCGFDGINAFEEDNRYETCFESGQGKDYIKLGDFGKTFLGGLSFLGADILTPKWWDKWTFMVGPTGLSSPSACGEQGADPSGVTPSHCVASENNDCVPKYAPANQNLCNTCSTTDASSPWDKCGEAVQCTSLGYCTQQENQANVLASATICLAETTAQTGLLVGVRALGEKADARKYFDKAREKLLHDETTKDAAKEQVPRRKSEEEKAYAEVAKNVGGFLGRILSFPAKAIKAILEKGIDKDDPAVKQAGQEVGFFEGLLLKAIDFTEIYFLGPPSTDTKASQKAAEKKIGDLNAQIDAAKKDANAKIKAAGVDRLLTGTGENNVIGFTKDGVDIAVMQEDVHISEPGKFTVVIDRTDLSQLSTAELTLLNKYKLVIDAGDAILNTNRLNVQAGLGKLYKFYGRQNEKVAALSAKEMLAALKKARDEIPPFTIPQLSKKDQEGIRLDIEKNTAEILSILGDAEGQTPQVGVIPQATGPSEETMAEESYSKSLEIIKEKTVTKSYSEILDEINKARKNNQDLSIPKKIEADATLLRIESKVKEIQKSSQPTTTITITQPTQVKLEKPSVFSRTFNIFRGKENDIAAILPIYRLNPKTSAPETIKLNIRKSGSLKFEKQEFNVVDYNNQISSLPTVLQTAITATDQNVDTYVRNNFILIAGGNIDARVREMEPIAVAASNLLKFSIDNVGDGGYMTSIYPRIKAAYDASPELQNAFKLPPSPAELQRTVFLYQSLRNMADPTKYISYGSGSLAPPLPATPLATTPPQPANIPIESRYTGGELKSTDQLALHSSEYYGGLYNFPIRAQYEQRKAGYGESLRSYWESQGGVGGFLAKQFVSLGKGYVIGLILHLMGDAGEKLSLFNPQYWIKVGVCATISPFFSAAGGLTATQTCMKAKWVVPGLVCTLQSAVNSEALSRNVCLPTAPENMPGVSAGFDNCASCHEDVYPCTAERCQALSTDASCVYDPYERQCFPDPEKVKACDQTQRTSLDVEEIDDERVPGNNIVIIDNIPYEDASFEVELKTNIAATCKWTVNKTEGWANMESFVTDQSFKVHNATLNVFNPERTNFTYFALCQDICRKQRFSDVIEIRLEKEEKPDEIGPVIIDKFPEPDTPIEGGQGGERELVVRIETDEAAECKYKRWPLAEGIDSFIGELSQLESIASNLLGAGASEQTLESELSLTGLEWNDANLTDVGVPGNFVKKHEVRFEGNKALDNDEIYAYVFLCRDEKANLGEIPGIVRFKVSELFDVEIKEPDETTVESKPIIKANTERTATCRYSIENKLQFSEMNSFDTTGGTNHKTAMNKLLSFGQHKIYVSCLDGDGFNLATDESIFVVVKDSSAPKIVRAYKDGSTLLISTDELTACQYSFKSFVYGEGSDMTGNNPFSIEHRAEWRPETSYRVVCRDRFGNILSTSLKTTKTASEEVF